MKRRIAVLLLALIPLSAAPRAFADKPMMERILVDDEFVVDDQCAFPVDVHETGILVLIVSTDENGVVHEFRAFPEGTAVLTNVQSGKSISLNISGPESFTITPGFSTLKFKGRTLFWPNPATGEPGFFLTMGQGVLSIGPGGSSSFDLSGRIEALCPQLA
jgi:hypothetical protein